MILYFSGTGNSRYIAGRIGYALNDEIIDLNKKIKENDYSLENTGENIILVTPTYAWRIPSVVASWISKVEFTSAKRIWFVMNCGSEIGNASKYNHQLANKKNLTYKGTMQIIMPENYIAMFNAPNIEEARQIVSMAEPIIDNAINCIKELKSFSLTRNNIYDRIMSNLVNPIFYHSFVSTKKFKSSDKCIGCAMCVKKCPMNNISLKNNKPIWSNKCTHCMACICYCPTKCIEYGNKSIGKPRYNFEQLKIK